MRTFPLRSQGHLHRLGAVGLDSLKPDPETSLKAGMGVGVGGLGCGQRGQEETRVAPPLRSEGRGGESMLRADGEGNWPQAPQPVCAEPGGPVSPGWGWGGVRLPAGLEGGGRSQAPSNLPRGLGQASKTYAPSLSFLFVCVLMKWGWWGCGVRLAPIGAHSTRPFSPLNYYLVLSGELTGPPSNM